MMGCALLYSEDTQDGQVLADAVMIRNQLPCLKVRALWRNFR